MKAMVITRIAPVNDRSLELRELPIPSPKPSEVRIRVKACGVCHTELDEIEGRLTPPKLPVVPGHQVVGVVEALGQGVTFHKLGDRVGVAWIFSSCRSCAFCKKGLENLCPEAKFTGLDKDGGYAEFMSIPERFAYLIPECFDDLEAAPLLCAGVIGYRALRLSNLEDGGVLGLFGFGASAHIVLPLVKHQFPNARVFVFTRPAQTEHQALAMAMGADWAGDTGDTPPSRLTAAIDFTPVGEPIKAALSVLEPSGRLVINAIRKETPIPELDYASHLWKEREIKSVANVTRQDALEFLALAATVPIHPSVNPVPLEAANEALVALKKGMVKGAMVLRIG
jgi:propanol-preferring alcohol dehydrogenase